MLHRFFKVAELAAGYVLSSFVLLWQWGITLISLSVVPSAMGYLLLWEISVAWVFVLERVAKHFSRNRVICYVVGCYG